MSDWTVENWLEDAPSQQAGTEYFEYWNDREAEREKSAFDVIDGDFSKMEAYLAQVGLSADLDHALALVERTRQGPIEGRGIDLAAGTLWAAPVLLGAGPVERLYCLEYSKHRLLEIGPRVLEHYGVSDERVVLAYGSFYSLRIDDSELDFALLSQAFHHAERPGELLAEMRRVLKPGGVVIMIGEHVIGVRTRLAYAARVASTVLPRGVRERAFDRPIDTRRTLRPNGADLVPTDPVLGDHVYTRREYERLFEENGFRARRIRRRGSGYQGFVLEKRR